MNFEKMEEFVKDLQERQKKREEKKLAQKNEDNKLNKTNVTDESSLSSNQTYEKGEIKVINLDGNDINPKINIDFSFKIIVIGNSAVGKSSLVDRGIKNRFLEDYSTTIGFDYSSFYVSYDSKIIKLQIWDTCGQEIYQSLITNFYRNSSLAILVYAINNKKSFLNIDNWLKELKKESNPDAKTILIGNKVDLESERKVSYEEAEKYAKDYNFLSFFETSAKTGFNAQKVFINTAISLYEDYIKYNKTESYTENEVSRGGHRSLTKINKKQNHCC